MSGKNLFVFVLFFGVFYLGSLYFAKNNLFKPQQVDLPAEVLAQEHENIDIVEVLYGPEFVPTPEPTATPQPKADPPLAETPKPTPSPLAETPTPVPTPTPDVWSPADMEPIFARYAGQYGIDKNVLERLANCESHFNPNANNGNYVGMFQFGEGTWVSTRQKMGEDTNLSLRSDIDASIKTAAYLISIKGTSPWPSCLR